MQQVLVYSDSLTWGIIPNTRKRLTFDQRWPGVLENTLNASGDIRVRIVEDCLNGRRTVWEDPFKPGRNGLAGLQQRIEGCSPLDLVILMLGTNDFQFCHSYNDAWAAAQGIAVLIRAIREAPIEPGMPVPQILLICPPRIALPQGPIAPKFRGANDRYGNLPAVYAALATSMGCHFFDANSVTASSKVDGVHLDADQHLDLGKALVMPVGAVLSSQP